MLMIFAQQIGVQSDCFQKLTKRRLYTYRKWLSSKNLNSEERVKEGAFEYLNTAHNHLF